MVDQHCAGIGASERTVHAVHDITHVVVVAHTEEHELGTLGRFARRGSRAMAVQGDPCERLLGRAVVDGDLMAVGSEVTGHGGAHHAEPDEGDGTH